MINVSIFYPNTPGKKFDMDYYCQQHIPMVQAKLGATCHRVEVDAGLAGGEPGAPAAYIAICHLYFDSVEAFQQSFGAHLQEILADVPNYTDISATLQISEVKI